MPLRDHFRPPLSPRRSWEAVHGGWPMMIVQRLNRSLPDDYVAEPQVHLGAFVEIDVAAFEEGGREVPGAGGADDGGGGVATAVWAPPEPTLAVATDLPDLPEYEVRVFDLRAGRRLVAAVELVSPANKDRPEHRRAFVAKCSAMLQNHVSVAIVDLVTVRGANLYRELLESLGRADASAAFETPLYAVACRGSERANAWFLEAWAHALEIGRPLPTLPLWLSESLAVPLDLEASYEETCRTLRIA
jgi:hypothetical protein